MLVALTDFIEKFATRSVNKKKTKGLNLLLEQGENEKKCMGGERYSIDLVRKVNYNLLHSNRFIARPNATSSVDTNASFHLYFRFISM